MTDDSKLNSVKKILKETILSSTGHGYPNIVRTNKWPIRLLWIISTLVSIGLCSLLIIQSILSYFKYEVTTKIRVINEFNSEFPTITVCNLNFLTTELFSQTFGKNFNSLPDEQFADLNFRNMIESKLDLKAFGDSKEKLIFKALENVYPINETQIVYFYHPEHGNCYQINSGFDQNGNRVPLLRFLRSGRIQAITLWLNVSLFKELRKYYMNNGGIVFIHNKTESPLNVDGVIVSPGFITNIGITRTFSYQKEKPFSNCDGNTDKIENYDSKLYKLVFETKKKYNSKICIDFCYQEQLILKCNCTDKAVIAFNEHKYCKYDDVCLNRVYEETFKNLDKICYEKCPLECEKISYLKTISSTKLGNDEWMKYYQEFYTLENSSVSQELAVVNIYYESLAYTEITEAPTVSEISLLSNIGGLTGLFLGLSLLSFIELIELIFLILFLFVSKKISNK